MDWNTTLTTPAPTLAAALRGPLAGLALKVMATIVLSKPDASVQDIKTAFQGAMTPELIAKLKTAETAFKARLKEWDVDLTKINAASLASESPPTPHDPRPMVWIGGAVLASFALLMAAVMYGCFQLLTHPETHIDPTVAPSVAGLVGTIVGYLAGNAQQVVGYWFGSSKGSSDKTHALSMAANKTAQ